MTSSQTIVRACLSLALLAQAGPALADNEVDIENRPGGSTARDSNELRARLYLSHSMAYDADSEGRFAFSDLRLNADATRLAGLPLGLHLDGRARRSWDEQTDDRMTVRDAYLRIGEADDAWNLDLGRQVVRTVAAAEVDGVRVLRRLGKRASATLFGGLMPHPITSELDPDFASVGGGYEHRGRTLNHSAGAVASWYRGELDRAYVAQRGYLRLGRDLSLSSFAILDLVPANAESTRPIDPTSLMGTLRYRPQKWLDSSLTATHHHTVLPGKWWADWLNERRREIGFVLDGVDPVGTRITSLRWTNNVRLSRTVTPYVRLRRDWRHTDAAQGYEGRAGLKWTGGATYANASYAYREYFSATSHLGGVELGRETRNWGVEAGLFYLRSRPEGSGQSNAAYDVSFTSWFMLGQILDLEQRLHLAVQYQGLFESESDLHALFVQLGYRV